MKQIYKVLFLFILYIPLAKGQVGDGSIKVEVYDVGNNNEPVIAANISVYNGALFITGGTTDYNGLVVISGIPVGTYDVVISYTGYTTVKRVGVKVTQNNTTPLKVDMTPGVALKDIIILEEKNPLLNDTYGGKNEIGGGNFQKSATRSVNQMVGLQGGVQSTDGGTPVVRGARTSNNITIIDGIPVRGDGGLPVSSYEQISIYASGVPAEFGDATGGVISITTKGPSNVSVNRFEYITSQFLDGYGYNTLEVFSSGPLKKKKIDETSDKTYAQVGYMLSGLLNYTLDNDPSAVGIQKVKDDVLNDLETNPLVPSGTGFRFSPEYLSKDDIVTVKVKPNTQQYTVNLTGKIDWQINKEASLTFGGRMSIFAGNDYNYSYSLLNYKNNSQFTNETYAGYVRFRQKFKTDENSKIKNPAYFIQLDYTHFQNVRQNPTHKDSIFNYGNIGKFKIYQQEYNIQQHQVYAGTDSAFTIAALTQLETPFDTAVVFTPSKYNSIGANYTKYYFDHAKGRVSNLTDVAGANALINGSIPQGIYSLYSNVGTPYTGYGKSSEDQLSLNFNMTGTIGKHNLKIGYRYEDRVARTYSVGATSLWSTMRQSVNRQLKFKSTNTDSAIFVFSDGDYYGYELYKAKGVFLNTIRYERSNNLDNQTSFDKNFRDYLISNGEKDVYGRAIDQSTFINPDAYDPSTFSLDWFSADDLLQNGVVSYRGFDHMGNKLKGKPSLSDYLDNRQDRKIAPYNPIYMAGYFQDEFTLKDLNLRLGVRIDRFDANQFVLADEFSLYPIKTASEVLANQEDNIDISTKPSTIGDDFKVYVDDPYNPTKVVGYRDGADWYTAEGNRVSDPSSIASLSNTGIIAPYLSDFRSKQQEQRDGLSENSFQDYKPQINVMPRVAVSFPISDQAMFFANYDVLTQRPNSNSSNYPNPNIATINDYYYLPSNSTGVIGNPNLKPEKTIKYELGFQQRIAKNMALKMNAYYNELRNMIQIVPRRYAYPIDYTTFGNIDFGTVKGFIFGYELRPGERNKNITLTSNYTLQFANATGSNTASQQALIQANQPNLRTLQPTNSDIRHNIAVSFDYRYGSSKDADYNGPIIGKTKARPILENTGLNLILNTSSGKPYSGQTNATQAVADGVQQRANLSGTINGKRYPWIFNVDMKIDKSWDLRSKDKVDESGNAKKGKPYGVQAYLWVRNLFDTRNIVGLYRFTGLPDDDGYLATGQGQQSAAAQTNPQTYIDLYNIKSNNPNNYTLPRLIRVGVVFNF